MTDKEQFLGEILSKIADELNITDTMYDKAVESYNAVGKWLGDGLEYVVRIMPQGSMNLGTVIRPIDDSDEYDVDLVCLLENGQGLSLKEIKNKVGDRLKANEKYRKMLDPEGKRCWTMQYEEFHMDILPCVPNGPFFVEPSKTEIKLTHKNDDGEYIPKLSNPYLYHIWFEQQMKDILNKQVRMYAEKNAVEIEKVPRYKLRTPLHQAVQLLKRHRDICFQDNNENAPISIIITTLAAKSYNGEDNLYVALRNILSTMESHIENRNGVYWIENPVMPAENFADKWNEIPERRTSFLTWLARAKEELIIEPLLCLGLDEIAKLFKVKLGAKPVERAFAQIGQSAKDSREQSNLYIKGLQGGLTTKPSLTDTKVGGHTFFGN